MSKKRQRLQSGLGDILGQVTDTYETEGASTDAVTNLTDVLTIRPDPDQPRQLLPFDLYDRLFAGDSPLQIMQDWMTRAEQSEKTTFLYDTFEKLKQLAGTISQHDLINPITIQENNNPQVEAQYLIITGERRWWSHIYLLVTNQRIQEREPDFIKATIAPTNVVRAVQLIENMNRDDLTAYEEAIGMQALYEEIRAQGIRKGSWKRVETLLNISESYRIRILRILKLSPEAQKLIQEHGLPEGTIRPITAQLRDYPELQVKALKQLIAWQQAVDEEVGGKRVASLVAKMLQEGEDTAQTAKLSTNPIALRKMLVKQTQPLINSFQSVSEGKLLQVAESLRQDTASQKMLIELRDLITKLSDYWED